MLMRACTYISALSPSKPAQGRSKAASVVLEQPASALRSAGRLGAVRIDTEGHLQVHQLRYRLAVQRARAELRVLHGLDRLLV